MNKQKGFTIINGALLAWFCVVFFGVIGWIMNIVDIAQSDFDNITGFLVLRIIGVFIPPLGAVLGYL